MTSISDIHKVYQLDSTGKAITVYIFGGGFIDNELGLFSEIELAEFKVNKTQLVFSKQYIHKDDSIRVVKKKILHEIGIGELGYNEIYLFSNITENIRFYSLFQEMTNQDTIPFDNNMLGQLLLNLNIDPKVVDTIIKKEIYSYDDLLKIIDPDISYTFPISLGQRFTNQRNLLFAANPFNIIQNHVYKENPSNPRLNFENQLILNNGDLTNHIIYLCSALNAFEYAENNDIDSQFISENYFPLLVKLGIGNRASLLDQRNHLIKENKKIIKKETIKLYEMVDLFYNMYYKRKSELPYLSKGIQSVHLILHPESKTVLPLDAIFKTIHATLEVPFIKYNAGSRKENIYRLYSEKISRTGKKIPYLPKNQIMNLSKITGKNRQISLFLQKVFQNKKYNIFIHFEHNGNIIIQSEFEEPLSEEEVENLLKNSINPVINMINSYLEQTGYRLNAFISLSDNLLEIISMKYITSITLVNDIDIGEYYQCLTSIFNVISDDISKGAILEFKRVENYQKMDAIASTITDAFNNTYNEGAILNILMQKFNMNLEESSLQLSAYLNKFSRIQGKFTNKLVDIAENPGFITLFNVFPFDNNKLVIEVDKINHISHIHLLFIYLDSFLRMSQYPDTSKGMKHKCSRVKNMEAIINTEDISHITTVVAPIAFTKVTTSFFSDEELDEREEELDEKEEELDEGYEFIEEDEEDNDNQGYEFIDDDEGVKEEGVKEEGVKEEGVKEEGEPFLPEEGVKEEGVKEEGVKEEGVKEEGVKEEGVKEEGEPFLPEEGIKEEGIKEEGEEGFEFSDYSDEDEDDEDEEDDTIRGGTEYDQNRKYYDNKPFKKKKIFTDKMHKKEPTLFLSKKQGNYSSYARVCPTNVNLQPVLLTPEEKERIDKEFPGSYNKALKYGTDPNPEKHNYYICPRYWCLLTNSSMTHEDVIAGKCGKIIPTNDSNGKPLSKIPPGHYVYEFTDDKYHKDDKGNYREHYPGFKSSDAHPDGLCIPCCYNNWDSEARVARRNQCSNSNLAKKQENVDKNENTQSNLYIVGIARFPIPQFRWGFLPPSVEALFQIDHMRVVNKNNPALISENKPILLRYGVEQSIKQSFIGCLADVYAYKKGIPLPSIKEMRKIIADSLTLDLYLKYHNGSLVSIFQPKKVKIDADVIEKYKETQFYRSINITNETQFDFLEDTIASFENFLQFLNDDNSIIDHTYLWDIVITSNVNIFNGGINLVIIEIVNNDITDNIEILCPTNSYSNNFYDNSKETVILLKHDEFYDPIYLYEYKGNTEVKSTKMFYKDITIQNIKRVLEIIQNSSNKYCRPLSSMPKIYTMKKNIPLLQLRELLRKQDYFIKSQVLNYQGKVIGLIFKETEESEKGFFIPCLPSASLDTNDLPIEFMDNNGIWNDYRITCDILNKVYEDSDKKIPCKPVIKVLEDNLIVGILTMTNQFVQVIPPSENLKDDDLEELKNSNYLIADKVLVTSTKEDEKRLEVSKNIFLESQFYLAFRSTLRLLINKNSNKNVRNLLLQIIESKRYSYREKLQKIDKLLRTITTNHITFQEFDKQILFELHEISTCTTNCDNKKYCLMKADGDCSLIIPDIHLVSGTKNNTVYFARLSDELLRNNRIRIFMFEPKTYLNITNISYKLNNNEFIILESLLTNEYFNDLIPFQMNSYVNNITYELSKPDITQKYQDIVPLSDQIEVSTNVTNELSVQCIKKVDDIYGNQFNMWKQRLPKKRNGIIIREIYFNVNNICSFYVIIQILQMKLSKEIGMTTGLSIANIKDTLFNAYLPYLQTYNFKIYDILEKQGKTAIIDKIRKKTTAFETMIMSEEYYLTDLDIWVVASKLNLPIVIFSLDNFKTMLTDINWLVVGGDINSQAPFYFIRSPKSIFKNKPSNYSLIDTPLPLSDVKGMDGIIKNRDSGSYNNHFISLDDFMRDYSM